MKKILCFGDSNTYGYIPGSGKRYNKNQRWSGILRILFANKYEVIEAGCNDRNCFVAHPDGIMKTGYKILPEYLTSDISIVILAIGINDLQKNYNVNDFDIKQGMLNLINIVKNELKYAKIIIAAPSVLSKDIFTSNFSYLFDESSIEKSLKISTIYEKLSFNNNCIFVDFNRITSVSDIDGLHYSEESHKKIAQALCNLIKQLS